MIVIKMNHFSLLYCSVSETPLFIFLIIIVIPLNTRTAHSSNCQNSVGIGFPPIVRKHYILLPKLYQL